ncbi:helix-turn-helix domain-containing protein [Nocardioides dilutus]
MRGTSSITAGEAALLGEIVEACRPPSDTPLPPRVLELVRTLLHAEAVAFNAFDTQMQRVRFQQYVERDGSYGFEGDILTEAESEAFWRCYWDPKRRWCLPDLTGDYTLVYTADDLTSLRQRRAWHDQSLEWFTERMIQAVLPDSSSGRHLRFSGWRDGPNFTHKDVLFLKLLRPHFERAYAANVRARRTTRRLTPRQLQVMGMVRAGLSNRQIARKLDVSEGTVHNHLTNVFARLEVQSRTAAVRAVFDATEGWPASPG